MKILSETLKYIFKNIVFVLVFAIIPACYIGGMLHPFSIVSYLTNYSTHQINNFGDILGGLFGMGWMHVIVWIFAAIILIIILSAALGNIENHFRSGKLNVSNSLGFINNNVLACSIYFLVYITIYLIFKFLLGLVIFILHIVAGRLGQVATPFLVVIVTLISAVALLLFAFTIMFLLLGLVDTLNSGYSFRTSMSNASELVQNNVLKLIMLIVIPFLIVIPLIVLGNLFAFASIANIVSLIILFAYFPVLAYTYYYEVSGITRYDNIKRYYY